MVNRLYLGSKKDPWLLADSEILNDLMNDLVRAAKDKSTFTVKARKASAGPILQITVNPSVIPFWFVHTVTEQKGAVY